MKIDAGSHKSGHNQAHHHLKTKTLRKMAKKSKFFKLSLTLLLSDVFIKGPYFNYVSTILLIFNQLSTTK